MKDYDKEIRKLAICLCGVRGKDGSKAKCRKHD